MKAKKHINLFLFAADGKKYFLPDFQHESPSSERKSKK